MWLWSWNKMEGLLKRKLRIKEDGTKSEPTRLHFAVLLLGIYSLQNIFYNVVGGLLLSPTTNKCVSYSVSHKYTAGVLQNRGDMICMLRVEMADNKILYTLILSPHLRWKSHLGNSHQTEWNQRVRVSCRDYMTALILYFGIKCTAKKRDQ